jgi:hypothetical protein
MIMGGQLRGHEARKGRRVLAGAALMLLGATGLAACSGPTTGGEASATPTATAEALTGRLPQGKNQLVVMGGARISICHNLVHLVEPDGASTLLQSPVTADGTLYQATRTDFRSNEVEYTPYPAGTIAKFYDLNGRPVAKPDCAPRLHQGVFRINGLSPALVATENPQVVGTDTYSEPTPQSMHACGAINFAHRVPPGALQDVLAQAASINLQSPGPCK